MSANLRVTDGVEDAVEELLDFLEEERGHVVRQLAQDEYGGVALVLMAVANQPLHGSVHVEVHVASRGAATGQSQPPDGARHHFR